MKNIVRIHTTSGTTGKPTVVGYTQNDLDTWADLIARNMTMVGVGKNDIFQNIVNYGMFTGGLGFHYGAEKIGMTVIPSATGNTRRQIEMIQDFGVTAIHCTPSYAMHLAEIATDPETRHYPVVICSVIEQTDKGFNLGASDYLVKPIIEEDIVNAINNLNKDVNIHDVMVIDDDPNDLRLIEKILTDHGKYKPIIVEGGRKGWEAINAKPPHAIVLDIFMPDMDGFTILEKLRESPVLREIPVLVVSGGGLTNEHTPATSRFWSTVDHQRFTPRRRVDQEHRKCTKANWLILFSTYKREYSYVLCHQMPGLLSDHKACECGAILRGVKKPADCRVFGTACTPENPLGSCMVSSEGACAAHYTYGRFRDAAAREAARA